MTSDASPEALTFVFTDLESSTRLWERFPEAMRDAVERHDAILRTAVEREGGSVVKATGDGLMAVFSSPAAAAAACLEAQRALHGEVWGETGPLRVRMGIHVGEAQRRADDFFGPTVIRAARIMDAAHGGQVLLSGPAAELAEKRLPAESGLRDLGEHRLKDLLRPEHLFQLVHPALLRDFPPLATLSHGPNNLPTQTSEFLGREAELTTLRDLLDADARLLTLTGPGGIGKTRLALHAAADQIDRFEAGVFFVDLSSLRQPDAVFEAIVQAVDLRARVDEPPLEVLKRALGDRHLLLLLDNFEQVIDAADGIVDLVERCPRLAILVTSREALRVRGEHLFPVLPLSMPDVRPGQASAASVAGYESVRLFVERAREAQPSFALTDSNAAAVVETCARLDGLPLAIELAAARLRLFSPSDLNDRLRSRLELLSGGPRDLPARQQTLRSTIEWSYELLDSDERALFELVSLFSPPRVETIEEVAARLEALDGMDVVERLTSLVDKSLVRRLNGDRPRLAMLDTIRDYAAERLDHDSALGVEAREAHAEYFSNLAASRRDRLTGRERESALDDLSSELGNLLTAWRYWVETGNLEQLNRLLDPLWALHDAGGRYHAAVELTDDLLRVLASVPATPERAREEITVRTSLARGLMAIRGYTQDVEEAYGRALSLAEEVGEVPKRFPVLRSLATFYLYRGEFDHAARVGRELLDLAEQEDDLGMQVEGEVVLGSSLVFLGDVRAGLDRLDRAISLFDPERHRPGRFRLGASPGVVAHTASALLLWLLGYPERAVKRATGGLDLAQELHHPFTRAYALFHVGLLDLWRRDFKRSYDRASGVLQTSEEHGYQLWTALALALQGVAMVGMGSSAEGLQRADQGIALYQGLKTPPVFWPLLHSIKAEALRIADRPAEGLGVVDEAIKLTGEQNILFPEFALLRGDLLLALQEAEEAERWYRRGLEGAAGYGLSMTYLRAAMRLARIAGASGSQQEGTEVLLDAYGTFTEGFDSTDLAEARAILDELGAAGCPPAPER
jgi:predicted ATPase/class 3 adenylate cyclase